MPLGTEVGLSSGDFVFDGDPATTRKIGTHTPPIFGRCLLWPKGWMDEDMPLATEVNLGRGHILLNRVPALRERGIAATSFRPMSIVAMVAHLSYC